MGKLRGIDQSVDSLEATKRSLINLSDELKPLLNSGLRFDDNFDASIVEVSDTGTADVEFSVTHLLGRIPTKVLIIQQTTGGVIYDSATANTDATAYYKYTVNNGALTLLIW